MPKKYVYSSVTSLELSFSEETNYMQFSWFLYSNLFIMFNELFFFYLHVALCNSEKKIE